MLFVSRPCIGEEEFTRVKEVLESGWLGHGSTVLEFEEKLKAFLNASHVIAVNTGTSALHLALDAMDIGVGDEVIVPSLTFCASVQAITAVGATPVFCDVQLETLNIDVVDAEARITSRTKAIMPVHYCGTACDMERLLRLGRTRDIRIVEDAAHAFGSSCCGKRLGGFGDVTCFSFDPIKVVTCGEGGAVALADDRLADIIRRKRLLGMDKSSWQRQHDRQSWFYEVTTQGYRYHMSNINAAIGLVQLDRWASFAQKRRMIVGMYNEEFQALDGLQLLSWDLDNTCPFAYVVRVMGGRRNALASYLKHRGIGTGINYIPNHMHSFFRTGVSLPRTESLYQEILTLPLHCGLTEEDIRHVIASVCSYFKGAER